MITDPPIDRTLNSSPEEHLADYIELAKRADFVKGPFRVTHASPTIDTGAPLFTPEVGERVIGIWVEFSEAFSEVGEVIGIGAHDTTDDLLQYKFEPPIGSLPAEFHEDVRVGYGQPLFGTVLTFNAEVPLFARTTIGGNTSGVCDLYVAVLRSAA